MPTVEAFERRGLAAPLCQRCDDGTGPGSRPLGHFAGIDFFTEQVAPSAWGRLMPGAGVRVWSGGERYDARWLAGCDGGRSAVRKGGITCFVTDRVGTRGQQNRRGDAPSAIGDE